MSVSLNPLIPTAPGSEPPWPGSITTLYFPEGTLGKEEILNLYFFKSSFY
jgi:hypothetical protein